MQRIVIIGSSGAGKSTLARKLGRKLNIPVIHLDRYHWQPGWVPLPAEEWEKFISEKVAEERWIIDGNYRRTLPMRLSAADTVIFLDLPRWLCVARAIKRRLQYLEHTRPDVAHGCHEHLFDPRFPEFLRWIWDYPERARPDVIAQLDKLGDSKNIVRLRSRRDVDSFLHNLPPRLPQVIEPGRPLDPAKPPQSVSSLQRVGNH